MLSAAQYDLLGGALAFLFTIALLSYLLGDNPLYRIALHLFIGVSIGYVALVVAYQVLLPRLIRPLLNGDILLSIVPLILFIFLILKLSPRTSAWGNIAVAFLIGVGTAVALGGAVTGTLLPQTQGASLAPQFRDLFSGAILLIGTVTTLLYFQFWVRGRSATGDAQRVAPIRIAGNIGQVFLVLTLAVIYGGMILSGIAIFSHQITTLANWVSDLGILP